jgi:chemotaxis protein CheD
MLTNERFEARKPFIVGIADIMVSQDLSLTLSTSPLGSGLGIAIYDSVANVGGILHSMLPDSTIDPKRAAAHPGMFLDTGLAQLLECAGSLKATKENLLIYVAGGSDIMDETDSFSIGKRNYSVLTGLLAKHNLRIHAEDVGGLTDRTMHLSLATGDVRLRFSGQTKSKTLCRP